MQPLLAAAAVLLPLLATGGDKTELSYRFELAKAPALEVRVEVRLDGSPDGLTTLEVDSAWGGVRGGGEDIVAPTAHTPTGGPLEMTRPAPYRFVVEHAPGEPIVVAYAFGENDYQSLDRSRYRRPILNRSLFRTVGTLALLRPVHVGGKAACRVRFEWVGFEEAGWSVASSWGTGGGERVVTASLDDIAHSLYLAGDVALLTRDIRGYPLTVTVTGEQWDFSADAFADLCARIVETERAFFDDFQRDFFWISLVPTGKPAKGGYNIGGTGLTNCFSMSVAPNTPIDPQKPAGAELTRILAHETFHEWNGGIIRRRQPEEILYWFSEGFTDFYARRLMYRGGFLDMAEYAASLTTTLHNYATNPYRDASNEKIRRDFWNDPDVQKLPYYRGDVLAMILDADIRRRSSGHRSLDDVMRALLHEARAGRLIDPDLLFRTLLLYASPGAVASVRGIVEDGGMPEIPSDLFAPCLEIEPDEVFQFDLGFDFARSSKAGTVRGVREDTEAFAAGLRNGMKLTGWSVFSGDVDRPATFRVDIDGETREITYLPRGEKVRTHRAVVVPGVEGCSGL